MTQREFAWEEGASSKPGHGCLVTKSKTRNNHGEDLQRNTEILRNGTVLAKSVPAAAVIQTAQALSRLAGRKESGDGYLNYERNTLGN